MMNIYLGDKGITSTSANYLANLAKEVSKSAEAQLRNICFTNKTVELINGSKKSLRNGWTETQKVEELIVRIANMNSFCAWMREAIKAREEALNKIDSLNMEQFCELKGIEYPTRPDSPQTFTPQNIYDEMNIKDKNNYLRLEAFAATFGKYVHPEGSVSKAREDALYREQVPNEVSGEGRDMVIYGYSSSVSTKEVDAMFMELQNKQREFEKQLNAIKYQANEEANKRTSAAMQKYKEEYEKYSQAVFKIRTDMNLYVTNGREEIANMKIIIPEKLQDTYAYLEALGKKK